MTDSCDSYESSFSDDLDIIAGISSETLQYCKKYLCKENDMLNCEEIVAEITKRTYRSSYLAGRTKLSNSAARCRRMMFFEGGIPSAVAIVSPVKDGSNTKPP